ncbi:hypothetical protein C0J52_15623 [Blattella germanica]|nr:hypothetical protein C0J52_15623 [Blattella germanica]
MSVRNAITYNIISSILSFIGMAIGVWLGEYEATSLWIYAFTAGSFLYISLVDLIPEMNNYSSQSSKGILDVLLQMAGITTGASIMLVIAIYEENLNVADFDTEADLSVQKKHQHGHQHGGHQHHGKEGESIASVAWIVIMGDGLHNLTDGLAIGAAFSGDIVAGFATAVAVLCHELPHELGTF